MINGFVNIIYCLFVVLDVNNKISFAFLSFRAQPSLLRPNDSLIYPNGVCTVGNNFLSLSLPDICSKDKEGSHCTDQQDHQRRREGLSQLSECISLQLSEWTGLQSEWTSLQSSE